MVRKRLTIGLVGSFFGDAAGAAEYSAVSRVVARRGANLVVFADYGPQCELFSTGSLATLDGILFSCRLSQMLAYVKNTWPTLEISRRVPALGLWLRSGGIPSAVNDTDGAFAAAVEHVVNRHARRCVAVLGTIETLDHWKHGPIVERFSLDPSLFFDMNVHSEMLRRVLPRLDAVVTEDAREARKAITLLQEDGFLVPDDIAIVACRSDVGAEYSLPSLTTCCGDRESTATHGARHLMDCLEKGEPVSDLFVPPAVVARESCGCRFMYKAADQMHRDASRFVVDEVSEFRDQVLQYASVAYEKASPADVEIWVDRLVPAFKSDLSCDGSDRLADELDGGFRQWEGHPAMCHVLRRSLWAMQRVSLLHLFGDASRIARAGSVLRRAWKRIGRLGGWGPDRLLSTPRHTLVQCAQVEHDSAAYVEAGRLLKYIHSRLTNSDIMRLAIVLVDTAKTDHPDRTLFAFLDAKCPEPILPAQAAQITVQRPLRKWFPLSEPFTVFVMGFFDRVDENTMGFVVVETKGGVVIAEACRRGLTHGVAGALLYEKSRRQQAELGRLNGDLERANRDLEAFAYTVSHDLKAPLRGIASVASWLSTDCAEKLNAEEREMLQLLLARVHRMHRLIDGVLRYSRAGRVRGATEDVDLDRLARDIVDSLCFPDSAQVAVTSLPIVKCDQTSMVEVISNLLSNGVKHNDRPEKRVRISCEKGPEGWVIAVADNGPGIAARHFDKIFQMFETLSAKDENTGVGLSVVRKLVEDWGGRIWIESTEGQGATFRFTLPGQAGPVVATDFVKSET